MSVSDTRGVRSSAISSLCDPAYARPRPRMAPTLRTHICTCTATCQHAHTHTHARTYTHVHTHMHVQFVSTHTQAHTHACAIRQKTHNTYAHTHAHTQRLWSIGVSLGQTQARMKPNLRTHMHICVCNPERDTTGRYKNRQSENAKHSHSKPGKTLAQTSEWSCIRPIFNQEMQSIFIQSLAKHSPKHLNGAASDLYFGLFN